MPKKVLLAFIFFIFLMISLFSPKNLFALYEISVNNLPQSIDANSLQDVSLELIVKLGRTSEYYLRAAFSHPDNPSAYFGYTDSYNGAEAKNFYKITTDEIGEWGGILKIKPDVESPYFKGEGMYNFKIGYYTAAGSGPTWKYEGTTLLAYSSPSPTPTSSSIPTSTLTPTSNPVPTSKPMATYKINEVRDEDGEILSNVKVYVDDVYLHHYTPEVLTFCDDCQCDGYVSCGFGEHIIKLEKTGYEDWNQTITVSSESNDEVSPVMIFSESVPTPTPTSTPTSTPKQTIVPSLIAKATSKIASDSGKVLGEEVATLSAFYPYQASGEAEKNEASLSAKNKIFPKVFLGVGLLLVFVAAFWGWYRLWYTQVK